MTIFDDLGKTLNDVAAATADMLGDLAETAKVKTTIVSEKHEMEGLLAELGKTVYEARKDSLSEDSDDPTDALCRKILEKEEKIAELEAREEEMKAKEEASEAPADKAEESDEEVSEAEIVEEEKEDGEEPKDE